MNIEFKCLKCNKVSIRMDASEFDIQCPKCRSWEIKPLRPVPYPEDEGVHIYSYTTQDYFCACGNQVFPTGEDLTLMIACEEGALCTPCHNREMRDLNTDYRGYIHR